MIQQQSRFSFTEWFLIVSNLAPLVGIFVLNWDALIVLFLYWLETAVIGLFSLLRMQKADASIGKRAKINNQNVDHWSKEKYVLFSSLFFLFHFGTFMSVHLSIIIMIFHDGRYDSIGDFFVTNGIAILALILPLVISHTYSYVTRYIGDKEYEQSTVDQEMMRPYGRVMLVHIIAFTGAFLGPVVLLLGKTIFDLRAHRKEHKIGHKPVIQN